MFRSSRRNLTYVRSDREAYRLLKKKARYHDDKIANDHLGSERVSWKNAGHYEDGTYASLPQRRTRTQRNAAQHNQKQEIIRANGIRRNVAVRIFGALLVIAALACGFSSMRVFSKNHEVEKLKASVRSYDFEIASKNDELKSKAEEIDPAYKANQIGLVSGKSAGAITLSVPSEIMLEPVEESVVYPSEALALIDALHR